MRNWWRRKGFDLVSRLAIQGLAFAIVAAFWWWTTPLTRLAPWKIAVLPGGLLGAATAWRTDRWSLSLLLALTAAAIYSAALGEWFDFHHGLMESIADQQPGGSSLSNDPLISAQLWLNRLSGSTDGFSLAIFVSLLSAFQAARLVQIRSKLPSSRCTVSGENAGRQMAI